MDVYNQRFLACGHAYAKCAQPIRFDCHNSECLHSEDHQRNCTCGALSNCNKCARSDGPCEDHRRCFWVSTPIQPIYTHNYSGRCPPCSKKIHIIIIHVDINLRSCSSVYGGPNRCQCPPCKSMSVDQVHSEETPSTMIVSISLDVLASVALLKLSRPYSCLLLSCNTSNLRQILVVRIMLYNVCRGVSVTFTWGCC